MGSDIKVATLYFDITDQLPKHMNFGQYIVSNVPSLKGFREPSTNLQNGTSTLKALSSVMISLQRYSQRVNFFSSPFAPLLVHCLIYMFNIGNFL